MRRSLQILQLISQRDACLGFNCSFVFNTKHVFYMNLTFVARDNKRIYVCRLEAGGKPVNLVSAGDTENMFRH